MKKEKKVVLVFGPKLSMIGGVADHVRTLLHSPLKDIYTLIHFIVGSNNDMFFVMPFRIMFRACMLGWILIRKKVNIVHINTSLNVKAFWRDAFFLMIIKCMRRKVLFQIHGGKLDEFWSKYNRFLKLVVKIVLSSADIIALLSEEQKKPFENMSLNSKLIVIPNMIRVDDFTTVRKGEARERLILAANRTVIVFVSRFVRAKGVYEVLEAIPIVLKNLKEVLFLFVGDGEERKRMEEFCSEHHIREHVKFTGYISGQNLVDAFTSSDIFVFPTYYSEGFPVVILQAMAAGLPIVSCPTRAIPEIIVNGENGYLVPPMNSQAVSDMLLKLLTDKNLRKKMGQANITKVKKNYDITIVSGIFAHLYEKLSEKSKR